MIRLQQRKFVAYCKYQSENFNAFRSDEMKQLTTRIFLCGMPGSGKSTLGKRLARHLEVPFYDLDDLIEASEGRAVKAIFKAHGEAYFREAERNALAAYIQSNEPKQTSILALGGGTPCFFDNMQLIRESGVSVFLDTPIGTITARMLAEEEMLKRPLMAGVGASGIEEELRRKYRERVPFYNRAHFKIKGDESIESISSLIISFVSQSESKANRDGDSGIS